MESKEKLRDILVKLGQRYYIRKVAQYKAIKAMEAVDYLKNKQILK